MASVKLWRKIASELRLATQNVCGWLEQKVRKSAVFPTRRRPYTTTNSARPEFQARSKNASSVSRSTNIDAPPLLVYFRLV